MTGIGRHQIADLLREGRLQRLRRGWYALTGANAQVARAVALGGRVGCLTGCALHGLWVPQDGQLHTVFGRGAEVRHAAGVLHHPLDTPQPATAVCPLIECLEHVIHRHDAETALICLESAANRGLIKTWQAHELINQAGYKTAQLRFFHPASQSGSETRVRLALQQAHVPVRPQVWIPGAGYVDLLVGDSLIIECDSDEYHIDLDADHRRDMAARRHGCQTVRLSYQQIWHTWDDTKKYLFQVVRTRIHLLPARPLRP